MTKFKTCNHLHVVVQEDNPFTQTRRKYILPTNVYIQEDHIVEMNENALLKCQEMIELIQTHINLDPVLYPQSTDINSISSTSAFSMVIRGQLVKFRYELIPNRMTIGIMERSKQELTPTFVDESMDAYQGKLYQHVRCSRLVLRVWLYPLSYQLETLVPSKTKSKAKRKHTSSHQNQPQEAPEPPDFFQQSLTTDSISKS